MELHTILLLEIGKNISRNGKKDNDILKRWGQFVQNKYNCGV